MIEFLGLLLLVFVAMTIGLCGVLLAAIKLGLLPGVKLPWVRDDE